MGFVRSSGISKKSPREKNRIPHPGVEISNRLEFQKQIDLMPCKMAGRNRTGPPLDPGRQKLPVGGIGQEKGVIIEGDLQTRDRLGREIRPQIMEILPGEKIHKSVLVVVGGKQVVKGGGRSVLRIG